MIRPLFFRYMLVVVLVALAGCALGKKEWPAAQKSEDAFNLELTLADRQARCLMVNVAVSGAIERLYSASIQYEVVGDGEGEGCIGCPFIPRDAVHFTRHEKGFYLQGNKLKLSFCGFDPEKEYRFRIAGKSELSTAPLVYTDIFIATP